MKPSSPWAWIPTLYFAQGLPYVAVMTISVIMYKRLGISNAELAFYTGWLNLPWVIKPLWSPFIDLIKTKRWWITWMQLLIGAGLAGIAFTIPTDYFFQFTLAIFWLMAFSSATHDIAADGFYMLGLSSHEQALFVGIRSTFYRIATIAGQGLLIMLAGHLEKTTNNIPFSWSITFMVLTGLFLALWAWHKFILPRPDSDKAAREVSASTLLKEFGATFVSFFHKKQAVIAILFMLLYRLPEAQLAKMSIPFLIDPTSEGGLGLTTEQIGFVQGTVGIIGLTLGGILGGGNPPPPPPGAEPVSQKILDLTTENQRLRSEKYTDRIAAAQGVVNATQSAQIACLEKQVDRLYGLTKLVVPNGNVAPGWGPVDILAQAASAASASTTNG